MTTTPVSTTSSSQAPISKKQLNSDDFIKMMITQLQNQDPLEPAKNQELMAQMSQIGQLQNSTQLQETLKTMAMQSQIGSAGNLIGKSVTGLDAKDESISGVVTSVRVEKDNVQLELDGGQTLSLNRVSAISAGPAAVADAASATSAKGVSAAAAPQAATGTGNSLMDALTSLVGS